MLRRLSVRDIILIDRLDLEFEDGLAALTGETGAGKSILLDSLGLALGARGDAGLVRPDAERAIVTAEFDPDPAMRDWLADAGIHEVADGLLIRRTLGRDGRSRAFINDQPVTVALLRRIGERLVEVHGQFERYGLLNPASHRAALDAFGQYPSLLSATGEKYGTWRQAVALAAAAADELARARAERDTLVRDVADFDELTPEPGEEPALAERRELLRHAEKLITTLNGVTGRLGGDESATSNLHQALRDLAALADFAGDAVDPAVESLERATVEVEETLRAIQALVADIEADPTELEAVEERLFALRALARRHECTPDELPQRHAQLLSRLDVLADEGERLTGLARVAEAARRDYTAAAEALSKQRAKTAAALEAAVAAEFPPLHLGRAELLVRPTRRPEGKWSATGIDHVVFQARTNPGMPIGPLHKIASGGELSRFMLALNVVLAATVKTPTLVFDEVDAGVGGATAAAIGERLARLAEDRQVLAVTHSPQVAARARQHLRVSKRTAARTAVTEVDILATRARREEIARMLSGAEITDEARAAADRLIAGNAA